MIRGWRWTERREDQNDGVSDRSPTYTRGDWGPFCKTSCTLTNVSSSSSLLQSSSLRPLAPPQQRPELEQDVGSHVSPSKVVPSLHSAVPTFSILVLLALVEIPSNPSAPFAIGECIKLLSLLFSCHRLVPLWPSGSCHLRSVTTMAWNSPGPFYPPFPLVACLFLFHASLGLSSRSFSRSSLFGALLIILVHLPSPPDLNTPVSDLFWLLRLLP